MRCNHTERGRRGLARSAGFTLFEVVIALAIAGIGLAALLAAASMGLGNAAVAGKYIEAARRAQSRLVQIGVTMPLNPGEQSGDDGGGFAWRVRISQPLAHALAPEASGRPPLGLYTVRVTISWYNGATMKNVSLQSQRLGRISPPDG